MTWFDTGADAYAQFRPTYPPEVAGIIAGLAPDREVAVDIGCGSGQFTSLLASEFARVIGVDSSAAQLDGAKGAPNVAYVAGSAEEVRCGDGVASLVTVAQAAHWFDLPAFYSEARRIARQGAVLALLTYGPAQLEDSLAPCFEQFYRDGIRRYWPPERIHVDNGYADLYFPFDRIEVTVPSIGKDWTLDEFIGYLGTWSAARRARDAGESGLLDDLRSQLEPEWGAGKRRVEFALTVLAGRLDDR
ncbi:class I SAM-dependent methyltransferase [Gordonia zhaorongruii]|uniref:class I SAM-dependent methyltransferase n=1 Tax=Gordonia zhaorongruii TaxID=2597659 RepID=UPI00104F5E94|nr:methyltransferase domain-containing protein [Gordonia zhaorongruii]